MESGAVKTLSEVFDEACPYYMALGMTYDEYWYGDPFLTRYYEEANLIRAERENEMLWMQGVYFYKALEAALYNHLNLKKGGKPRQYLKEAIRIRPLTKDEQAAENEKALQGQIDELNAMQKRWEQAHENHPRDSNKVYNNGRAADEKRT